MGELTFLGAPHCSLDATALRVVGARAAFLGAGVDTGVMPSRQGTPLGPDACRRASAQFADNPVYEYRLDVGDYWQLVDCGDAASDVADIGRSHAEIRSSVEVILDGGAVPILFGGDHSIPIPGMAALCSRLSGRVGYLQIDAHLDTAHDFAGETRTMASPVARIVEQRNVSPANVAIVGVRGAANSFDEIEAADELGVHVFPMSECNERGVAAVIEDALDAVADGTEAVYVSFDNDGLDASCAPGTTSPEPGGFTAREMLTLAAAIGRRGVAMLDVAELSPPFDHGGITARLDCYWILYILASYADALERGEARPPVFAAW
ncbi:MAG: agmatinase family protein [Actinobacteria bacterium]|nr:agmatinase family protein [Actinomycetota bacterium]